MKYYIAYGSNLNIIKMKSRCPNSSLIEKKLLYGYKLFFKGSKNGYAYLTIEEDKDSFIPVGVFKISFLDEINLNKYEDYPELYSKKTLSLKINGKIEKAMLYIMNDEYSYHMPSMDYFDDCIEGYHNFNFDEDILKKALIDTHELMSKQLKK